MSAKQEARAGTLIEDRMPEIDDVFLSRKSFVLHHHPFPYAIIDDFVDEGLYRSLTREFPRPGSHIHVMYGKKAHIGHSDPEFTAKLPRERPQWARMIELFKSDAFAADAFQVVRRGLIRARWLGGVRRWRAYPEIRHSSVTERPVQLTYEWASYTHGGYIHPHTDKPAKLLSFIWYFTDPDWRESYGGSTDLSVPKKRRHRTNWSNRHLPFKAVENVVRSTFRPNRCLIFLKPKNSYHGVSPVSCPPGMHRCSCNFNLVIPIELRMSFGNRAFESYHRRTEAWRFRDHADINRKG